VSELSSRSRHINEEKDRLIAEFIDKHGRQPSSATIIKLRAQATLATRPEKVGSVVRRLLAHGDSHDELILSAGEYVALGKWLLKVGLLSAHPAADHDHPGLQRDQDLPQLPTVRAEWLE